MRGSIVMYAMNAEMYTTRSSKNWSNQERDLKAYLGREHQFRMTGTRSAYNFCMAGQVRASAARISPTFERESHAWHMANIATSILVALRLRRPDRAGE